MTKVLIYACVAWVLFIALQLWQARREEEAWAAYAAEHDCALIGAERYGDHGLAELWRCEGGAVRWRRR